MLEVWYRYCPLDVQEYYFFYSSSPPHRDHYVLQTLWLTNIRSSSYPPMFAISRKYGRIQSMLWNVCYTVLDGFDILYVNWVKFVSVLTKVWCQVSKPQHKVEQCPLWEKRKHNWVVSPIPRSPLHYGVLTVHSTLRFCVENLY